VKPSPRSPDPPRRRRCAGFTIAEVMVAGSVMVLAITTAITTMQSAFLALDTARGITTAGQILQSEIERMRLKDWAVIDGYAAGPTPLTVDPAISAHPTVGPRFTLERRVGAIHADLKEITLRVAWRGYDGRAHSRFYRTYYGRNGLYDYFYNSN
jgi:hypothetical protein